MRNGKIRKLSQNHVWGHSCGYCLQMRALNGKTHDDEIMDHSYAFCISEDWPDLVYTEVPYMDHAQMSVIGQIRILEKLHQETGCPCHISDIEENSTDPTKIDNIRENR